MSWFVMGFQGEHPTVALEIKAANRWDAERNAKKTLERFGKEVTSFVTVFVGK